MVNSIVRAVYVSTTYTVDDRRDAAVNKKFAYVINFAPNVLRQKFAIIP